MHKSNQAMKRVLSLLMALAMVLSLMPASVFAAETPSALYLTPNGNWKVDNARFAAYFFGNGEKWVDMTDSDGDGIYEVVVPSGYPSVIFCRMNPTVETNSWDAKWNQSADLTVPTDGTNHYTVAEGVWDQGSGIWSTYTPSGEEEDPVPAVKEYYLVGFINGADYTGEEYKFENGKLTVKFSQDSYVVVKDNTGYWYLAEAYCNDTSVKLIGGKTEKMFAPKDLEITYTLVENGDGTLTLSYTASGEGEETPDPQPEATYVIAGTADLCGTEWDVANTANKMALNAESGLYEKTYQSVGSGTHKFKVTDGTWDNAWPDSDYELKLTEISNVTITFNAENKEITVSSEPTGEEPDPVVPVTEVTIHYRNTGVWSKVNYHAWVENGDNDTALTSWPGTELTENEEHSNWYTVTLSNLNAPKGIGVLFNDGTAQTADIMITANGEYWYDEKLLTAAPDTWADGSVPMADYKVTLHFADVQGWGGANLYIWGAYSNGGWPGAAAGLDQDGFYSLSYEYEAPEGQGLNFIFSGYGQTVDLKLDASAFAEQNGVYTAEKWVVPTTQDSEEKWYADIVDHPGAIATGPVVNGKSVTFKYKNEAAQQVAVYGTMDVAENGDWIRHDMTRNQYGVFSVTLDEVAYGIHQYKLVVNNEWIADPLNHWTVGNDGNSAFLISDPNADRNEITIKVHYDAPSEEWNVCAWGANGLDPQYDFVDDVATITLDGRGSQYVAFKVRKSIKGNSWAEQSGEIRVDLGKIVSGTIDVWVDANFDCSQSLNDDVVDANKVSSVELDYDKNTITVKTSKAVSDYETAFAVYKDGANVEIIESISASGSTYTLKLKQTLDLVTLYQYTLRFSEQVKFTDHDYVIGINTVYASDKFAAEYTYDGDLGVLYTKDSTTFKLWAPTAEAVRLRLYSAGNGTDAEVGLGGAAMELGEKGVWSVTLDGDLNGTYYTYEVDVAGKTVEAVDPYARTTGVNGNRGMIIDLDSTDPADGWTELADKPASYTDAIIYELHVRDFSIDDSSGVKDEWKGKFLGLTQTGTKTANGAKTGLDYLKELGFTHLHLLPVYDYGSVDETKCENFNWGYDPVNYNVPEGSYSTDPYDGASRVKEMKEMVDTLHENGIGVVMDVVYNHVYDAGKFCFNQIVPGYFSRTNADGSYSNGSGCGNDTASEREMVRKYIVESVLYWHQEYHIDGFRFDLVGLLDATTINQIVDEVHACCPDVIFYGEGWTMGTAVEPGNTMATQDNSAATPNFAYFSDTIRNLLAGSNGSSLGFVSGQTGKEEAIRDNFMAKPGWSSRPSQIVQYASCHDNYTLIDKLILSTGKSGIDADIIKMNNLAAAIYMTSQGIPFIHAGEEFLREKLEEDGGRCENSYNASDYVNHLEWSNLEDDTYAANSDYYKGLIAFRKAHPALRFDTRAEIDAKVEYSWITNEVVMFTVDGTDVAGESAEKIAVIFNATKDQTQVSLPEGEWIVCVDVEAAGNEELYRVASGTTVYVDGISAMVLVQNKPVVKNQVTNKDYETLEEALADVKEGETLQLQDHVKVAEVDIPGGITLDLNGHTLEAECLAAFGNLVDTGAEKGLLKIPKESIMLQRDNEHMSIWVGDGYIFNEMKLDYLKMADPGNYIFKVMFKPSFGKLNESEYIAKKYFVDEMASADNGIEIILRLSWEDDSGNHVSQDFSYTEELVKKVYSDPESKTVFTLGVTRLASDADVQVEMVVYSNITKVEICSELNLTYTN